MFVFALEFQSNEEYNEFAGSLQIPALGGFPDTVDDWFRFEAIFDNVPHEWGSHCLHRKGGAFEPFAGRAIVFAADTPWARGLARHVQSGVPRTARALRDSLLAEKSIPAKCREISWYKYTKNTGVRKWRDGGRVASALCWALGVEETEVASWSAEWRRTKASLEVEARHASRLQSAFNAIVCCVEVHELALPGAVEAVRKYAPGALVAKNMSDLDATEEVVRALVEGRDPAVVVRLARCLGACSQGATEFAERMISFRSAAIWAAKQRYTPVSLSRAAWDAMRAI